MQSSLCDILYAILLLLSRGHTNYFAYFFLFCFLGAGSRSSGDGEYGILRNTFSLLCLAAWLSVAPEKNRGAIALFLCRAVKKGRGTEFPLKFFSIESGFDLKNERESLQ